MSDSLDKIVSDLPTIRQIALRPLTADPLVAVIVAQARVILSQARALEEIAAWARSAEQLTDDERNNGAAHQQHETAER